jgi:serine/threonine protein kinase
MPRESLTDNIYNEKTDLWALGITLYEMVFG